MSRLLVAATLAVLVAPGARAATVELHPGDSIVTLTSELNPGDEFVFADGVYEIDEQLHWSGTGTESQPILLVAASGATPVIRSSAGGYIARVEDSSYVEVRGLTFEGEDAHYENDGFDGLQIGDSDHVTVQGVEIRHTSYDGLYLFGNNSAISVSHTHIHDSRSGYGMFIGCWDASCWTQDSVFDGNWVHDIRGDNQRGIQLAGGAQGNEVTNNVVYQVNGYGIVVLRTELGPQNVVEGNVVWNALDVGLYVGGAALVRNNIVFNVDGYGIRAERDGDPPLTDEVISHNTVYNTTDYGVYIDEWNDGSGLVFANNVVANPVGRAFRADEGHLDFEIATITGNVMSGYVFGLDPLQSQFSPGAGATDFSDAESWDFYPSPNSLLVNAADPSGAAYVPELDFNGLPRDGAAPEVGAYEFFGTGNPGWVVREGFKELTTDLPDIGEDVGGCCSKKGSEAGVLVFPAWALLWGRRRRQRAEA